MGIFCEVETCDETRFNEDGTNNQNYQLVWHAILALRILRDSVRLISDTEQRIALIELSTRAFKRIHSINDL